MKIQFKVASTTYTVQSPEKQMEIEAYCAKITRRTGRTSHAANGFDDKHSSMKRDYPKFNPRVMLTSDYVTAYTALNHKRLHLVACDFAPAVNRTPPGLDPAYPEVVAEIEA